MTQAERKLRALIIDDEKSICESLAGVVEDEGWTAVMVGNGPKGLVECKLNLPDLVFLDIWMPGMDGITVLQNLKDMYPDLPVVIMSGHATIETAVRATRLGAFEVLEKPLELEKIVSLLDQAKVIFQKKFKRKKSSMQVVKIKKNAAFGNVGSGSILFVMSMI